MAPCPPQFPPLGSAVDRSAAGAGPATVRQVPVDLIRPGRVQSRRRFDEVALRELAGSIRESGIVQPLIVRGDARGYELLAGERRWRAAQMAGLHEVPAIVRNDLGDDEAEVLGLVENLQREALSPMETAAGLRALGEHYGLTHEAIGTRIGKSRVYVTNFLRLLALDGEVQSRIDEGLLSLGHAKVLAGLGAAAQREWAARTIAEGLSVRALERRSAGQGVRAGTGSIASGHDAQRLARQLSEQLGYPVVIDTEDNRRGELRIRFHSLDELQGLLDRLGLRADG